jgi:hypothetical protein
MCSDDASAKILREIFGRILVEEELSLSQIYNADETGLFWKPVPENTQANKKDMVGC